MARRNSTPPPANGGYAFEVIELGPPEYYGPVPVVKARGGLIPVGEQPRPVDGVGTNADPSAPPKGP